MKEIRVISKERMSVNGVESNTTWLTERYNNGISRSVIDIARRAVCLCLCASKAEGLEVNIVQDLVKHFDVESYLQFNEFLFINERKTFVKEEVRFIQWGFEASQLLFWSLGLVKELPDSSVICNPYQLSQILVKYPSMEMLCASSKIRNLIELAQETDYNLHVFNHCCSSSPPYLNIQGGYMSALVFQREKALRWLFADKMETWDGVKIIIPS